MAVVSAGVLQSLLASRRLEDRRGGSWFSPRSGVSPPRQGVGLGEPANVMFAVAYWHSHGRDQARLCHRPGVRSSWRSVLHATASPYVACGRASADQLNSSPVTHLAWRMAASFGATATFAFLKAPRLVMRSPNFSMRRNDRRAGEQGEPR